MKQWIIRGALVFFVFAAVVGFAILSGRPTTESMPLTGSTPSLVANRTTTTSVRAAGVFASASQATLSFQLAGRVKEIRIKKGAQVKAGDLLATLDTSMLESQIAQAQAALDTAQAKLGQLQNPSAVDVAAAQANVAFAEAALAQLKTPTQNDLAIAKADFDKAQAALQTAQAAFDHIGGNSNPQIAMTLQSLALQQSSDDYQKALAVFNAKVNPSDTQLKQALAAVAQAHDQLERLTNPSANDLKSAQAAVAQAQAALNLAKQNIANAQITAPFSGAVVWIGPHLGESVSVTPLVPAISMADLSQIQVKVGLDEQTLSRVKLGQTATITADSLPDTALTGKVSEIGLQPTTTGGAVSVPVTIDVDPTGLVIVPGLSATVEIDAGPVTP